MTLIRCYCLGQGGGFRGWHDSQDDETKAKIEFVLELLCALSSWHATPLYEELRGKCAGLGEIKVDLASGHYRLLVCEHGKHQFTILRWFNKRTNADYAKECPQALERKAQVLKDVRRTEPWPFDEDEAAGEEVH